MLNWGIIGTGNIARSMADALKHVPQAQKYAVASRHIETADQFAKTWGFQRSYGSFADLLADRAVDIVYIATPNSRHKQDILDAIGAGKHVLCEKPMTLSAQDSADCFAAAHAAGVFLMEALWTAFFPAMQKAIEVIQSGTIGPVHYITANFVSYRDADMHPILFDPNLAGGARNDLGIYPLAAALLLAGPMRHFQTHSFMGPSGVDEMTTFSVEHENGALSVLTCGFRVELPVAVTCVGAHGTLEIPNDFHRPNLVRVTVGDTVAEHAVPFIANGYAHEAIAFQARVLGETDDVAWGQNETLSVARVLQNSDH